MNAATSDIFGCAASLAANPDMRALNRHVATLPASRASRPPAQFYTAAPANYYAKFWHDNAIDRLLAYGFPYDDVAGRPPSSRTPTRSGSWSPSAGRHGHIARNGAALVRKGGPAVMG